jgi:hypothetical protein
MKLNTVITISLVFFTQIFFVNIALSKEAEVLFIDTDGPRLNETEEIQSACDLMGVRFTTHFVRTIPDKGKLKSDVRLYDKEVLILTGRVLKYLKKDTASLFGQHERKTKILVLDINSQTDIADLKIWSENRIKNFRLFDLSNLATSIRVARNDQISMELGGLEYPSIGTPSGKIVGVELADSDRALRLIELIDESGNPLYPVFLKTDSAKKSVFFLTSWGKLISAETHSLLRIMPILMFLKFAFGDRCWHGINDYANLTIDDPWLIEPYGYMSFAGLCREAKKARFHVSIGFIPYNYLRSRDNVVEIFRQCPRNLSIAVHGNNHDLSEFRSRGNERSTDKKSSEILPDEKNILQALYRMDTFSRKTGLPYDQVMIFAREVFSKESLGLLKKHNFLMTVSGTRPLNTEYWSNNVERMRGITLEFDNFPMVLRSRISDWKNDKRAIASAKSWIQMRLFLDLPVLLCTHHDFFKDGADEFNAIAGMINNVQPEVVWTGLGDIARKLYLQKRISTSEIEILAYSSDMVVKNNYAATMKFVVRKQEDFLIPIQSVEVDGVKHEYHKDGNRIRIEVLIDPGHEKNIRILYQSDYQIGSFTYSDSDLQATIVRTLSDFRDLHLSKLFLGDKVTKAFYGVGGVKNIVIYFLVVTGIILLLLVWYIKSTKSKRRNLL